MESKDMIVAPAFLRRQQSKPNGIVKSGTKFTHNKDVGSVVERDFKEVK